MSRRKWKRGEGFDAFSEALGQVSDLSTLQATVPCSEMSCDRCRSDQEFLRNAGRLAPPVDRVPVRAVDLFVGCGGMSIGLEEAARRAGRPFEVALAVDLDEAVLNIYKANVPKARTRLCDAGSIFNGAIGAARTKAEEEILSEVGEIDFLLGGPPCQGHSDLNNHTRRHDPRNVSYLLMARAAEVLCPKVVIIENVPPVLWDTSGVVAKTTEALSHAGYKIAGAVVDLRRVGVPQRRRRYLLIGSRVRRVCPTDILAQLTSAMRGHPDRTVRWAVHDLLDLESGAVYNTASRTSVENARRIQYLFDEDRRDLPNSERPECHRDGKHSYISMYGRLSWDDPAQTITTGFGSMGQGRYVHPEKRRTITPHEAARLQTFPDWFDFGKNTRRGILAKAIGNAVPPLLMVALGDAAIEALSRCEPITIPIPS